MKKKESKFDQMALKYGTIFTLMILFIIFSVLSDRFLHPRNLINILKQVANLSIVALGLTAVIIPGELDLSIGDTANLSGVVVASLLVLNYPIVFAMGAAVLVGVIIGIINGVITTKAKIPSIIVTLGMSSVALGVVEMITGGKAIYGNIPPAFNTIGQGSIGPASNLVYIMIVFIIIMYFILNKTIFGRHLYAVGGNMEAAKLSGINTSKLRISGFVISATFGAIAGVLLASRLGSGQPYGATSFTMDGLGAVFVGMTTIKVGKPNVIGTIIGVFLIGIMSNGLNMLGLPYYIQSMAKGAIMIFAVAFAASKTELKFFRS